MMMLIRLCCTTIKMPVSHHHGLHRKGSVKSSTTSISIMVGSGGTPGATTSTTTTTATTTAGTVKGVVIYESLDELAWNQHGGGGTSDDDDDDSYYSDELSSGDDDDDDRHDGDDDDDDEELGAEYGHLVPKKEKHPKLRKTPAR